MSDDAEHDHEGTPPWEALTDDLRAQLTAREERWRMRTTRRAPEGLEEAKLLLTIATRALANVTAYLEEDTLDDTPESPTPPDQRP